MDTSKRRLDTKLVHAGEPDPRILGAVAMPIFQSAMFEYAGETSYHDLKYIRLNNTPNHAALHQKLAALENAEAALVTASGMAAISTALLTVLKTGDHILFQDCLYGGTHDFATKDLPALGIDHDFIDLTQPDTWKDKVTDRTKAIYVESITNPLMQVGDLKAVPAFAREHGLVSMIDNTFATPVNFRPVEAGFDLSLHSCTKYLNGHSDIVAGAVIGGAELVTEVTHKLNHFGGSLDPHSCFLLHRGLKTLALRVRQHNANANQIAILLRDHPAVSKVNYPGLETDPSYAVAKDCFDGFGGMLSFELAGGLDAVQKLMEKAELPILAPSLGGPETLLTRPSTTSHVGVSPEERQRIGISDALVRMSVGLEDAQDLIEDLEQALG